MDLRVEKTKQNIQAAFLDLRRRKPLEKITVKELCQGARIHKSTFYAHYEDLYALSDALETEVVERVIFGLPRPEDVLEHPGRFTRELFRSYAAQEETIQVLFSGSRSGRLVEKLEEGLKQLVFRQRHQYAQDEAMHIFLSYSVYGAYFAYTRNRDCDPHSAVELLGRLSQAAKELVLPSENNRNE